MMRSHAYAASLVVMPVGVMRLIGVSVEVDQGDVGLVVHLEIAVFERHPTRAEAVIVRDQLSATAGSVTRWRILRARKSEISALASRSTRMSRKLPIQMPKPGSP